MLPRSLPELTNDVAALLRHLDPDPTREGLKETPARVAKAFEFWTSGYAQDPKEVLKVFEDGAERYDGMIWQKNIPVYSLCEHHLAPFFGSAHVAYVPNGKVVGLSKISRLVDIFARRLQVQERLTQQISHCLLEELGCRGVGVVIECRHLCMESRGVQKCGTMTTTSSLTGVFLTDPAARAEFLALVAK